MESTAARPTAHDQGQGHEQQEDHTSAQTNPQQSNTQAIQQQQAGQQAGSAAVAATAQAPNPISAPDLNALSQGDLASLSLQNLPADLNLMPLLGPDGNPLSDQDLINLPFMMPMNMDGSGGMMNMPIMPQNMITNGTLFLLSASKGQPD